MPAWSGRLLDRDPAAGDSDNTEWTPGGELTCLTGRGEWLPGAPRDAHRGGRIGRRGRSIGYVPGRGSRSRAWPITAETQYEGGNGCAPGGTLDAELAVNVLDVALDGAGA